MSVRLLPGSWPTTAAAEHDAREHLLARDGFSGTMCTHIVPERQHIVVTVAEDADLTDEPDCAADDLLARDPAVQAHARREGGRAFIFPGSDELTGAMTIAAISASTAIDDVLLFGGGDLAWGAVIDTQSFVRPHFVAGRLVLTVRPAVGGLYVPFEQPNPTPCCADHA